MNSRLPISGLDRPSRASRATRASWAVSATPAGTEFGSAGSRLALRTGSPADVSSRLARSAKRLHAHRVEHLVSGPQLLAAQPLAVEQVGTSEFGPEPGAAEPADRLLVAAIRVLARTEPRLTQKGAD